MGELAKHTSPNIVKLYDRFSVKGRYENTFHEILAMEVILPLNNALDPNTHVWDKLEKSKTIKQIFEGFEYIKHQGVTHGGERTQPRWVQKSRLIVGV